MAFSVVMPALEMAQETGTLLAWRKKEGDSVAKGEPLLEIETDKAVVEVEAPADGILAGINAEQGAVVPVGQTIAWIVKPGESLPTEDKAAQPSARATSAKASAAATPGDTKSVQQAGDGHRASPKARRLAQERGVDLTRVKGSGPEGAVLAADVIAAPSAKATSAAVARGAGSAAPGAFESPSAIGRLMAERTTQSWTTVPHFFVTREVDASALNSARQKFASSSEARVTHTDLLAALVARVLLKHPRMNASWAADGIHLNPEVNISLAMAVKDGVVAPVIRNADVSTIDDIAAQRQELTDRARAGKLRPSDLSGGTLTISNLGMFGVDAFVAIITPPQVAILAIGAIVDRVIAVDSRVEIRPMMSMTASCDHRVVDGAQAAIFLKDLAEAIADPEAALG